MKELLRQWQRQQWHDGTYIVYCRSSGLALFKYHSFILAMELRISFVWTVLTISLIPRRIMINNNWMKWMFGDVSMSKRMWWMQNTDYQSILHALTNLPSQPVSPKFPLQTTDKREIYCFEQQWCESYNETWWNTYRTNLSFFHWRVLHTRCQLLPSQYSKSGHQGLHCPNR